MSDTPESQPTDGQPNDGQPTEPENGWAAPTAGGWVPPPPPSDWDRGWRDPTGSYPPPPGPGGYPPPPGPGGYPPPGDSTGYGPPVGGANGGPYPGGPYGPGGAYGSGGPYGYWQPQWGGQTQGSPGWYGWGQNRPRRSLPGTVIALLLAVAVVVGLGIGHGVWNSHVAVGSSGGTNAGGNGFGGNGFGSGGDGSGGNGSVGNGSGGDGSGGNGSGGNGSGGLGDGSGGSLSGVAASASHDLVDIDTALSYEDGEAAGTGIVLSSDGYILTNNHVISGATSITATDIANGQKYTADVVGYDRTHDVAVIQLRNASGLKVASLGNSSQVSDSEDVVGLGNAGGVGGTPSEAPGQVTDLNQSITAEDESNGTSEKLSGLIETDCDIQPGDSGGALIDSSGQVVGMDTAASTGFSFETQGNQGFAIPINEAISIANQIRSGQTSDTVHIGDTAFLGVEIDTSQAAQGTQGAVVSKPISGGPAAAAGIVAGDVITGLGGQTVNSSTTLTNLIGKYHPGNQVSITWLTAGGQTKSATLVLANGPAA